MANSKPQIYGLLAKFQTPEQLVDATRRVYQAGYRKYDAYSPYPIDALTHSMHIRPSRLTYVMLLGGILGGAGGFFMLSWATVIGNPFNIGGRPLFSWPAYIPITFELTVLTAAIFGVLGLFAVTRFPQPYHPVFNSEDFRAHASQDSFYLDIQANDPQFNLESTRQFLQSLGPQQITELEA